MAIAIEKYSNSPLNNKPSKYLREGIRITRFQNTVLMKEYFRRAILKGFIFSTPDSAKKSPVLWKDSWILSCE